MDKVPNKSSPTNHSGYEQRGETTGEEGNPKDMHSSISPLLTSQSPWPPTKHTSHQFPNSTPPNLNQTLIQHPSPRWMPPPSATLKSPRGFGAPSPKKTQKGKKKKISNEDGDGDKGGKKDNDDDDEDEEGVIPEIVTNRMIKRMGLSIGIPLFTGLMFFPFFYYLKVGLKVDVPTWVPFIVSFFFFGSALLGVSYGIVSSSWDPMREGSLLGWNEAQKNWPVFWQSLWGNRSDPNK